MKVRYISYLMPGVMFGNLETAERYLKREYENNENLGFLLPEDLINLIGKLEGEQIMNFFYEEQS